MEKYIDRRVLDLYKKSNNSVMANGMNNIKREEGSGQMHQNSKLTVRRWVIQKSMLNMIDLPNNCNKDQFYSAINSYKQKYQTKKKPFHVLRGKI